MSIRIESIDRARNWFRTIAIAEAFSWAALLIGMYFKYVPETTEKGVQIFGMVHGIVFIAYVISCLALARTFEWSRGTLILGLVASIPPFCTVIFEVLADRRGLLGRQPAPAT